MTHLEASLLTVASYEEDTHREKSVRLASRLPRRCVFSSEAAKIESLPFPTCPRTLSLWRPLPPGAVAQ
ncbi:hypothetical protein PC123_g3727 [Phytophthora cactorum]|nr:hypothetical protein PC123_g3727 [Phytophthora cactorum]